MNRSVRALAALSAASALASAACSGGGGETPSYTVTVQPAASALCVGDSLALTAQVLDGSGAPVGGAALSWSSSTPQVASVDPARGVARALATGTTAITASYRGSRSAPASLDVPADLLPEFVPDSVVLAPGDTMTLGVRLRRASAGLVPSGHVPAITPSSGTVANLDASGLVTAKAAGRAPFTVSACGQTGGGAADVFTPSDSVTGSAYLWLSGHNELHIRLGASLISFTRTNGRPAVDLGDSAFSSFAYVDTAAVSGPAALPLDSLNSGEVVTKLQCAPPRPFATFGENSLASPTVLFSLQGGSARVTSYAAHAGYTAVSGRLLFRMRGVVRGHLGPANGPDTLTAVYTFSAPLVTRTGACP